MDRHGFMSALKPADIFMDWWFGTAGKERSFCFSIYRMWRRMFRRARLKQRPYTINVYYDTTDPVDGRACPKLQCFRADVSQVPQQHGPVALVSLAVSGS